MTQITSKLAAFGLVLVLLGLPIPGESDDFEPALTFNNIEDQWFVPGGKHYLYDVEDIDEASSPSADFAQTDATVADARTVAFLEQNVVDLWDQPILMAEYGVKDGLEEPTAQYAAADQPLDWHRLRFLEENLWDYDDNAEPQGGPDAIGDGGASAIDPDRFSEEILWQDLVEDNAEFLQTEPDNFYPEADDVPQLHAGELNY